MKIAVKKLLLITRRLAYFTTPYCIMIIIIIVFFKFPPDGGDGGAFIVNLQALTRYDIDFHKFLLNQPLEWLREFQQGNITESRYLEELKVVDKEHRMLASTSWEQYKNGLWNNIKLAGTVGLVGGIIAGVCYFVIGEVPPLF